MSLKNGEMHVISAFGAAVLAALITIPTIFLAESKAADAGPALEDMEVIEASIAMKKQPQKQPQKKIEQKPQEQKPEGVSRDEKKVVEENVCKADKDCKTGEVCKKGKCEKPHIAQTDTTPQTGPVTTIDPDSQKGDKPTTAIGAFNDSDKGWAEETKGHPFFQGLAKEFNEAFSYPSILEGQNAFGCIHLLADGTIAKYKVDPKSGNDPLDDAVERALKKMKQDRASSPAAPPIELLKQATTRWICFDPGKLSRSE